MKTACQSGRFRFISLMRHARSWHNSGSAFAMLVLVVEEDMRGK
jgi:hypothetical protein